MNYVFHREAIPEHLDQIAFYESQFPGLGADYLAEFAVVMERICATPDRFAIAMPPDIRKLAFKRFPFHVMYRAEVKRIVILAIAHQRRRALYWAGRIGQ